MSPREKRPTDTVRMIAYRAETALATMLTDPTTDTPAARRLLQDLFVTEADILPELENSVLRIRVHNASRPAANSSFKKLFEQLTRRKLIIQEPI